MDTNQFDRLVAALERIADAMEGQASAMPRRATRTKAPEVFDVKSMRATVEAALGGKLASIDELRNVMNMRQASAQAVSRAAQACGFTRHRGSAGVRFAIVVSEVSAGRPLKMPAIPESEVDNARKRTGKNQLPARGFLVLCHRAEGSTPRVTDKHVEELHRLYPGVFA